MRRRFTCAGGCRPVGSTPEGIVIVSGAFPLVDTHGIPLDVVLDRLKDAGVMPDWLQLHDAAVAAGWKHVPSRLAEAVGDVYGPTFREAWTQRFTTLIEGRERGGSGR